MCVFCFKLVTFHFVNISKIVHLNDSVQIKLVVKAEVRMGRVCKVYSVSVVTKVMMANPMSVQTLSKTWELSLYELHRTPQVHTLTHSLTHSLYLFQIQMST